MARLLVRVEGLEKPCREIASLRSYSIPITERGDIARPDSHRLRPNQDVETAGVVLCGTDFPATAVVRHGMQIETHVMVPCATPHLDGVFDALVVVGEEFGNLFVHCDSRKKPARHHRPAGRDTQQRITLRTGHPAFKS